MYVHISSGFKMTLGMREERQDLNLLKQLYIYFISDNLFNFTINTVRSTSNPPTYPFLRLSNGRTQPTTYIFLEECFRYQEGE